jgi:hypothetical protein
MVGMEYMIHGFTFNSYYFGDNGAFLYDKKFNYNYSVEINELNFPIQIRLFPKAETRKHFSPYFSFGYAFRYIMNDHLKVTSILDGKQLFNSSTHFDFQYPYLYKNGSSFINVAPGLQKNFLNTHHALFVEINIKYGITQFLVNESFTPSGLYFRNTHIMFLFGYKF